MSEAARHLRHRDNETDAEFMELELLAHLQLASKYTSGAGH